MAKSIEIKIISAYDAKGSTAAAKALADLTKAGAKGGGLSQAAAKDAQALAKVATAAAQAGTANQKLATETQKTAAASNAAAAANQKLATEQQRTAAAAANAAKAQTQAQQAALRYAQAQDKASQASARGNTSMAVLPRTIAGLSHEAAAFATASLSIGAAVTVATAAVNSFADAFQFKAQLDATTLAVNAQLQGMRDSGQVWNEASAFAQKFKLTQQETTQAISASIGVMRASKAPVEDILGVLARMQVLSPEQSLEEAAIALKALASGDTTSLVTRFEVGRDVANQMKQEIQGGADAVAVMSEFLGGVGIGMDVLAAKTTGAAGAIKDLAIAQEELKLAQAEFAQGPGLVILEGQIRATTGATRVLSGDFAAMGQSIENATVAFLANAAGAAAYTAAIAAGKSASEANFLAVEAQANATAALTGVQRDGGGGSFEFAAATNALTGAMSAESAAAAQLTAQLQAESAVLTEEIAKKQESELAAQKLAQVQATLAALGPAVAGGLQTAASAAAFLAARYNIASGEALRLVQAQAALAGAQAKGPMAGITEDRLTRDTPADRALVKSNQALEANRKLLASVNATNTARVGGAAATSNKLASIETNTGAKLSQIVQDTQAKLIAIDQKAADERAKIAADLANKIATSAADRRASNEADDLDLIGVTDEKEAQKLNDREKAQAAAREREVAAAKEANDLIAAGEAENASKVYDIRQKQIGDQQALDEKYAEKQRELAGNEEQLDALKQQYDEGTRANEEAAATRIAIAKAESEQKKAEVQAEKDAVIAAANEQANQVVSAAERSAAGVSKATGTARSIAVANLKAIGDAVTAIPSQKTITISVKQDGTVGASSGGGSGNKAAGGGNFMTSGPTTLRVGDNPGGRELVTVTPLSGKGTSHASGNLIALAGGGTVDAGGGYTTPIAGGGNKSKGKGGGGGKGGDKTAAADAKKALDEMKNTIQLLMDMAKLKEQIAALAGVPAFDIPVVKALVDRAQEFTAYVASRLVPITKEQGESLGRYLSAAKDAASLISDMAGLKKDIAELKNVPAFDQAMVLALIDRAEQFTKAVQQRLIPLTEFERDQIGRYTQVVGDVVGMLTDVADLKKALAEPAPPIDTRYIDQLIADAAVVTVLMRERLIPTTEAQADAVGLYASAVGDTVSILNDVIDLGKSLKESGAGAIDERMVARLADQAMWITDLVRGRLIPATEEQNEAASAYADLVGSSVSVLKDVASLSGNLFTDYISPTDAQIALLATDAQRIARGFFEAGQFMGKEGAEAGKVYAEGVGAAFSAAKDGLLVIDALKSGDFELPTGALAQFEASSLDILSTMEVLGARAALIPTADIAALQNVTSAISGQAEALIRLAAVPFGDLGGASAGLGASGGALGGATTIYNTFNLPQGSTQQTVDAVIRQLNTQMGARR